MESAQMCSQKRLTGFTLIELIVVIGVIGILMAILIPAVAGMRERAREKEAETTKTTLVNAIRAFRTEYGAWPCPNPDVGGSFTNAAQLDVIRYLLSTSAAENPNQIPFWETAGVVTNTFTKQPFTIIIDVDKNEVTVQ